MGETTTVFNWFRISSPSVAGHDPCSTAVMPLDLGEVTGFPQPCWIFWSFFIQMSAIFGSQFLVRHPKRVVLLCPNPTWVVFKTSATHYIGDNPIEGSRKKPTRILFRMRFRDDLFPLLTSSMRSAAQRSDFLCETNSLPHCFRRQIIWRAMWPPRALLRHGVMGFQGIPRPVKCDFPKVMLPGRLAFFATNQFWPAWVGRLPWSSEWGCSGESLTRGKIHS